MPRTTAAREEDSYVDVQQAARMLGGMSGERVRRRLFEGRLIGRLVAGRWLVEADSIKRYLQEQELRVASRRVASR